MTEVDRFDVRGAVEVRRARELVRVLLAGYGIDGDLADDVLLCLSEAVTNGILTAPRGSAAVRVEVTSSQVRVEVTDNAPRRPHLLVPAEALPGTPIPAELDEHGRGLYLLARVATCWGVEPVAGGKRVWFTVAVPALTTAGAAR